MNRFNVFYLQHFSKQIISKFFLLIFIVLFSSNISKSNNIQISEQPKLVSPDYEVNSVGIQFNLGWDNSWRANEGVSNYDGVWVFVKYKVGTGNWQHATLSTDANDYSIITDNGVSATIEPVANGKGVFIYRSEIGTGSNNWEGIQLKWNYGIDNVEDNANVTVKCFALEMCYVPQASFHLGSSGSWDEFHFYTYPDQNSTYLVESENEITIGTSSGNMYYEKPDYWALCGDQLGPIPAAFPKGYNAFWIMKYEISQEQYAAFLNTLTSTQKTNRFSSNFNTNRNYIKIVSGVYGCDGNSNNVLNELADGQNIACNFISWADGVAYADWAAMRPMTEMEYEKACRGTATPVANEMSWGNNSLTLSTSVVNSKTANEIANPNTANCNYDFNNIQGPIRVGSFARTNSTRQSAGASFYGVLELTGNLREFTVNAGTPTGRSFTGLIGDGVLNASGNADVANWPGTNAVGSGPRGGGWNTLAEGLSVSYRRGVADTDNTRDMGQGFRCVISLPQE